MSFFRYGEIFRSDTFDWSGGGISAVPGFIGGDEFPAGYSSADCSPAGSASASATVDHFALKFSCRSMVFHRTAFSVLTVCLSPGGHPSEDSDPDRRAGLRARCQSFASALRLDARIYRFSACLFLKKCSFYRHFSHPTPNLNFPTQVSS
jgi:hypothetical protein